MSFCCVGHFPSDFALQTGQYKPLERIPGTSANEFGMRVVGCGQQRLGFLDECGFVGFDFHS